MQLADYTGVLRRRWWLIVLVAILGTAAGVGYFKTAHKVYTATASVYVTATSATVNQLANGRTSGAVNLDTEAQVVQSAAVGQAAAKLMHTPTNLQQLIQRVSVTVPANSQVLAISCEGSSAAGAASCAQSFAQAYLAYNSASTTDSINSQISALQSRIGNLQSASAKLTVEAAALPANSTQRASDEEQLNSDHSQLTSLNSQVAALTTDLVDPSGGSIISNASPPLRATSPKPTLILPSGLLAGLLIGLVLAYLVDRRDRRIRGPRDVTKLNVPVLMSLPRKPALELAIASSRSPVGRDFSELAHILIGSLGSGGHVILVTGSATGRGAGLVAANLAVALSRSQPDVTLVCADLEGSVIPEMIGVLAGRGLTDVLAGDVPASSVGRHPAAAPRLTVITPGSAGADADDLQQDAVEQLLNGLRSEARWVIVETAPVTSGPDVYTFAHFADAAILVAETRRTRSDQVVESIEHLDRMGANVLGTVLLPSPRSSRKRVMPIGAGETKAQLENRAAPELTAGSAVPEADQGAASAPAGGTGGPDDADADQSRTAVSDRPTAEKAPHSVHGS
jgi:capsular polysaccharide biosynthesis protein/MinD-like ATPase involved in chromosome partitioning or flagellar assembly